MSNTQIRRPHDPSIIQNAAKAIEAIGADRTRLPLMVEFCGLPKAGKSTVLGKVKRCLDRLGFRVGVVSEAATTKFDGALRGDLRFFNLLTTLENLSQTLAQSSRRQELDVVLLDRGPFDSLVWFDQLTQLGLLSQRNSIALEEMVKFPAWFAKVRAVVFIDNDFATYCRRYRMDCTLSDSPKMSEEHFAALRAAYGRQLSNERLARYEPGFLWVRADSVVQNADTVTDVAVQMHFWNFSHDTALAITQKLVQMMMDRTTERVAVVSSQLIPGSIVAPMNSETMLRFIDSVFGSHSSERPVPKSITADSGQFVTYLPRPHAEATTDVTQLVAAAFIRHPAGGYYVFKRSKAERRPELVDRLTLVVGGHVDSEDQYLGDGGRNAVENCLFRELREELTHLDLPVLEPRFGIRVGATDMGRRHLALVYEVRTYSRRVVPVGIPGAGDFDHHVQVLQLEDLLAELKSFDDWSREIILQLAGHSVHPHD